VSYATIFWVFPRIIGTLPLTTIDERKNHVEKTKIQLEGLSAGRDMLLPTNLNFASEGQENSSFPSPANVVRKIWVDCLLHLADIYNKVQSLRAHTDPHQIADLHSADVSILETI